MPYRSCANCSGSASRARSGPPRSRCGRRWPGTPASPSATGRAARGRGRAIVELDGQGHEDAAGGLAAQRAATRTSARTARARAARPRGARSAGAAPTPRTARLAYSITWTCRASLDRKCANSPLFERSRSSASRPIVRPSRPTWLATRGRVLEDGLTGQLSLAHADKIVRTFVLVKRREAEDRLRTAACVAAAAARPGRCLFHELRLEHRGDELLDAVLVEVHRRPELVGLGGHADTRTGRARYTGLPRGPSCVPPLQDAWRGRRGPARLRGKASYHSSHAGTYPGRIGGFLGGSMKPGAVRAPCPPSRWPPGCRPRPVQRRRRRPACWASPDDGRRRSGRGRPDSTPR